MLMLATYNRTKTWVISHSRRYILRIRHTTGRFISYQLGLSRVSDQFRLGCECKVFGLGCECDYFRFGSVRYNLRLWLVHFLLGKWWGKTICYWSLRCKVNISTLWLSEFTSRGELTELTLTELTSLTLIVWAFDAELTGFGATCELGAFDARVDLLVESLACWCAAELSESGAFN